MIKPITPREKALLPHSPRKSARWQRTRAALQAVKAKGKHLVDSRDRRREAKAAAVERAKALAPLFDELAGKPAREIARMLNDRHVATPSGKPWSAMAVIRARNRLVEREGLTWID
jgi:DNA invertase Pin-like site-specific DNA recombinase